MLAYQSGAGPIGSIVVGLTAGAITLVLGQALFAAVRSPALRGVIAAVYAAPAGFAGYHAVHGLSGIGGTSEPWRVGFAIVGALVIAGVAWGRISAFHPGEPGRGLSSTSFPRATAGAATKS